MDPRAPSRHHGSSPHAGPASSSFLGGGRGSESVLTMTQGSAGDLYVAGYTLSADFPTGMPFQRLQGGGTRFRS